MRRCVLNYFIIFYYFRYEARSPTQNRAFLFSGISLECFDSYSFHSLHVVRKTQRTLAHANHQLYGQCMKWRRSIEFPQRYRENRVWGARFAPTCGEWYCDRNETVWFAFDIKVIRSNSCANVRTKGLIRKSSSGNRQYEKLKLKHHLAILFDSIWVQWIKKRTVKPTITD